MPILWARWASPEYLKANGFNGVPAMFINDYTNAGFPNAGNDPYGNYKQG